MVSIRDYPADNEVLILGPKRQGDHSWVPEDPRLWFRRLYWGYLRDVLGTHSLLAALELIGT